MDLVREALYDRFGADLALGCTDYRAVSTASTRASAAVACGLW